MKWITEIRVVDRPFLGYWQARDYFRWEREMGEPVLVPLNEMMVKSQIARPINGSEVLINQRRRVSGRPGAAKRRLCGWSSARGRRLGSTQAAAVLGCSPRMAILGI